MTNLSAPTERPFEIHADVDWFGAPVEVFSIEKQKDRLLQASDDYISTTRHALDDTVSYLPFFAEKYNISADIRDYVLSPVSIFLSGIPNKKGHCFTYQELTSADTEHGCLKYKTWEKKPLFENHRNKDYTVSRGIILSSSMQKVPNLEGNLYKVILLQAYDRRTWPKLGNQILSGECYSYSMGATCKDFKCSVCSGHVPADRCGHIPRGMLDGSGFKFNKVGDKLAYVEAQDIFGFECSALPDRNNPANPISYNKTNELLKFD